MGSAGAAHGAVGGDETWESSRGRLMISHPAPHVILFTYSGYLTADFVPFVEASVDRVLATGIRPDIFVDLGRVSGYESEYRRAISQWGARNYRRFGQVRFLVQSRIMAMGVTVSNLTAEGIIKATTKRSDFEAALQAALCRSASLRRAPD
jgi:hypothetical protein